MIVGGNNVMQPACATGLIPRDYSAYPSGYLGKMAAPFSMPLIDESEWDDRIREQELNQSSLEHIRIVADNGKPIRSLQQGNVGYCWIHSGTNCNKLLRAVQNLPYVPLSAFMAGCIIKNYRNEGGWGSQGIEFVAERGQCSEAFWPEGSMSRANEKPEMWANAKLHQITEWWDGSENREQNRKILATCLLLNLPCVCDYNWWGHSVCGVRLVKRSPFTVRIWNSWADSWGDNGMGDLVDSKAIPDGLMVPRVSAPSVQ